MTLDFSSSKAFQDPTHCPCGARVDRGRRIGEVEILICRQCGSGVTSPRSAVDHASYVALPSWSLEVERRAQDFRGYQRFLIESATRFVRGGRLLDIGCSTGLLVDEAKGYGFEADGIDLDPNAIELGRKAGRNVHHCDLSAWPHKQYDLLTLSHILEHVPDLDPFLTLCVDHVARGGYLLIAVPCLQGLLPRMVPRWWYGWVTNQHYWHFSPRGLDSVLRRVGLSTKWYRLSPMDHRIQLLGCRWQDAIKSAVCGTIARVGGALRLGDQLVLMAQKQ